MLSNIYSVIKTEESHHGTCFHATRIKLDLILFKPYLMYRENPGIVVPFPLPALLFRSIDVTSSITVLPSLLKHLILAMMLRIRNTF